MQGKVLCSRVLELCTPKADELEIHIWDVEFEKEGAMYQLTIYLDSETGIHIDHCEQMSRFIDPILDEKEFDSLPSYTLCVSSAGAERKLTKPQHFTYAVGKKVLAKFYKAIDGVKVIEGVLVEANDDTVTLEVAGQNKIFDFKDMASIRLIIEF